MASHHPARPLAPRTPTLLVAGLLAVVAAFAVARADPRLAPPSWPAAAPVDVLAGALPVLLGPADGVLPDGTTVFDDKVPGVANLDPALLAELRRAAKDAAHDGVTVVVNSGWRSRAYQELLFREAVAEYGSEKEAARWVATPDTSAHVSGRAVDVGPTAAAAWLSEYGADYGLCRTYANEPWHYELRPDAAHHGCPRPYADATQDRVRQGPRALPSAAPRRPAGRTP